MKSGGQESQGRLGVIAAAALASAALILAGCGGGSHSDTAGHDTGGEADQGQQQALEQIPQADRTAFLELATALGTVRARAAPVAVGTSARLTPGAPLLVSRARVAALRPADPHLAQIRAGLLALLTRFAHAPATGRPARVAARRAIAVSDRLEVALRAYSRSQPAIGGLIPD